MYIIQLYDPLDVDLEPLVPDDELDDDDEVPTLQRARCASKRSARHDEIWPVMCSNARVQPDRVTVRACLLLCSASNTSARSPATAQSHRSG